MKAIAAMVADGADEVNCFGNRNNKRTCITSVRKSGLRSRQETFSVLFKWRGCFTFKIMASVKLVIPQSVLTLQALPELTCSH